MRYPFNLSEPLVIPRKKISTFVEAGLCIAYIWLCWDMLSERLVFWIVRCSCPAVCVNSCLSRPTLHPHTYVVPRAFT